MNKKLIAVFLLTFGVFFQTSFGQTATVNKLSLNMYLRTDRPTGEWRWRPNVGFQILGDFDYRAAKVKIDFSTPAGKSLFSYECKVIGQGYDSYKEVDNCGNDIERELATNHTGLTKFKISLIQNGAAAGELYSGSIKIDKFLYNPAKNPAFNKNFVYYIKFDWKLPMTYIGYWKDEYTPQQLVSYFWAKSEPGNDKITGQLTYKGKVVAEVSAGSDISYAVQEDPKLAFNRLRFIFQATFEKPQSPSYDGWWKLYENPGEYELKVTRRGELARTVKFEIGSDGKIVDNGVGKKNKLSQNGMLYFPEVLGDTDGVIDRAMFADGWFGNPIIK